MATLPSASVTVSAEAGTPGSGEDVLCIMACVPQNADLTVRQYTSGKGVYQAHGYAPGVDFASMFASETRKPFLFIGLPIENDGVVGQVNTTGNSGSSTVGITAGGGGALDECDVVLKVYKGGTIGSSQIVLDLSLDEGVTFKRVRLGTGNSYAIPYVNLNLTFGAGALVTGDTILTAKSTAPRPDSAGVTAARTALASQLKLCSTWLLTDDSPNLAFAQAVLAQVNAYETANQRFNNARVQLRDHVKPASLSTGQVRVSATVTFAEVGASADTITRTDGGSWVADGVLVGDLVTVSNTALNNFVGVTKIVTVTSTVITLGTDDLIAEVGVLASFVFTGSITFNASGETAVRNRGSWITDGYRAGQTVVVNSASNDGTYVAQTVTPLTLTFASGDIDADEVIRTSSATFAVGETKAVWANALDAEYAPIDSETRINLMAGRARKISPLLESQMRRPAQWFAAIRQYQHDVHIPTWRKSDGPLSGVSLFDAQQRLVEYDDRVDDSVLSGARIGSLRTWGNGPNGTFVTLDLTRDVDGGLMSLQSSAAVVNLAMTVTQRATEEQVGETLVKDADGHATSDSLKIISALVNAEVQRVMYDSSAGEGRRCSSVLWTPNTDDDLSGPEALLTGVLELNLLGVIHSMATVVKVR